MSTLLHLDSSPMGDTSVSRELSAAFVAEWLAVHPGGRVIHRDLYATAIEPIDAAWVAAVRTPASDRTPVQAAALARSDALIGELEDADEYVLGVPVHNFGVPAVLKLWIDQVTRAQRTFSYGDGSTPAGLLTGKQATFIVATGGPYMDAYNFVGPYLLGLFGFLGVTNARVVTVNGTMALNFGADRETFLTPHRDAAAAIARAA
jgi:FMN-dependent NADH-azoreductase